MSRKKDKGVSRLTIFCLIVLFLTGAFILWRWVLSRRVQTRLAAIRAAGLPTTLEELDEWYPVVLKEENAAASYRLAFAKYVDEADTIQKLPIMGAGKLPAVSEPLSAEMRKEIAEYLADNAEALGLLHQAAQLGKCRFSNRVLPSPPVKEMSNCLAGTRKLALGAILAAEHGDSTRAVRNLADVLAIGRSLQNPLLLAYLMGLQSDRVATTALARVLSRTTLTEEQLRSLGQSLERARDGRGLKQALIGERCFALSLFFLYGNAPGWAPNTVSFQLLSWIGLYDLDRACYLDRMEEQIRLTEAPGPLRLKESKALVVWAKKLPSFFLISSTLQAFGGVHEVDLNRKALLVCAATALAVERWRLAKGHLPESLQLLVPQFLSQAPIDPFDKKPIRYKRKKSGFIVYSVGRDLKDNSGIGNQKPGRPDIVFTVAK